ncbi:MAG: EAL domain-containing protein [Asticcacaulis sp.]
MTDDYKAQRDSYMAFSLAAADLLVEVDAQLKIVRTIGATQALLNEQTGDIKGRSVCDLFAPSDRSFARRLLAKAQKVGRIEPCSLQLDQGNNSKPLLVNMGACHLATQDNKTYVSLTVLSSAAKGGSERRDAKTGLLGMDDFRSMAEKALEEGAKAPKEMKMVRLAGLSRAVRGLPSAQADMVLGEIGSVLRAQSAGGQSAARLSEEEFSYLPPARGDTATSESLSRDFKAIAVAAGLAESSLNPTVISLELSTGTLDQDSVARALSHALTNFCIPENAPMRSLEQGLKSAMAETVKHFDAIRNLLEGHNFTLFYQPVVILADRSVHHYEALMRFRDGRSPYETIRLSEQLGLVPDFDLAAAREAITLLNQREDVSIAVNVSGQSVQNEAFRENLRQLVLPYRNLQSRLMFELTESAEIVDLDAAGTFLRWLRRAGFLVCLDDFGAGAAAYAYLRQFDVDYVKIDGPFLRDARDNPRQRALVRSVSNLCKELKSEVVAEMIEDEEMARLCSEMGITYGQGYLFGKPKPQIETPRERVVGKRRGFSESWG